jgi:hypothetical protein
MNFSLSRFPANTPAGKFILLPATIAVKVQCLALSRNNWRTDTDFRAKKHSDPKHKKQVRGKKKYSVTPLGSYRDTFPDLTLCQFGIHRCLNPRQNGLFLDI